MKDIGEIHISPTKFPDELCSQIIKEFKYIQNTKPSAIVNFSHLPLHRQDKVTFLDDFNLQNDFSSELGVQVNEYLDEVLREYLANFETLKTMSLRSIKQKVQETDIGGGYHIWHCEQGNIDTQDRVLTWTIYLNDVEEGGETEFLYQSRRIKSEKGNIVIFPAYFTHTHRGNPPISNKKYRVTGWYNLF